MARLTVQVNEGNAPALGVEVIVQLAQPDRLRASGARVQNDPITRHTNLQGLAVFDLPASTEYVGQSLYAVRIAKSKPVSFAMPAQDRTLNQILASPQPTTPGNLPSAGTYAQATSPPNPAPGTIWFDTSQVPPLGQWWDGTAWNDLAQASGGGLNQRQVDARVAAGVADWAEEGNTDDIPADKLGNVPDAGLDTAAVDARIKDFARTGGRSIQTGDIGNVQITNQKIAGATLDNRVMANDAIDTDNIQDDAVTQAKIADNAVGADQIATGAVGGTEIAPDSVGTSELANNAVTNIKMADDSVGSAEIQANAVGSSEIAANAVGSSEIAAGAVGSSEIATNAVTATEIANNTIVDGNLSTATQGRLLPAGGSQDQVLKKSSGTDYDVEWAADEAGTGGGGLTQAQVDARVRAGVKDYAETGGGTIQTADIGDDQITSGKLASGAVDAAAIGNNVVSEAKLAQAVTDQFVPAGGTSNQVLAKASATDYDTQWVAAASGGAGTPLTVTPRSSTFTPSLASTALTPGTEVQVDIAVGTVATNHPLSVTSNGIVVTTGTDPFVGTIQTKLAVDPTAWQNSANAGGNRLFLQSYWKKDGTIVEATRQDYYIRGDERYAPTEHLVVADATLELTAGTYTLFINKIGQAAAGNEINSIQINATSSNITLVSADYSGGDVMTGGGGLDQAAVDARVTAGTKVFARSGGRNVRGGDIDSDTITAANLAPNSVGASELADDAVDSGAIADDAVTQAKIANDAVGADQLAANSVGSSEIATNAVTATEIANQTIVAGNIANDAVGNAQIATDAVRADQIQAGAVGSSELAANAVGASELADNAVDSGAIANLAVTEAKLASNAVSERTIQDDAVRAAQIQAGAVGTSELANDAVTAAKIDTDAVGSAEIAAGAVGTSELANNAVTPAQVHSTLASRLVPAGGDNDQILAKSSDDDYATEWIDAPAGSGGGGSSTFLGLTDTPSAFGAVGQAYRVNAGQTALEAYTPATPTNLVMTPIVTATTLSLAATTNTFRTAGTDLQLNMAVNAGNTTQGSVYGSNMLEINSGITAYLGHIQANAAVTVQDYQSSSTSGGNRLFFEIQLKRNGTVIATSRNSTYFRARSGWAPSAWWANITYTGIINPSDRFTVHIVRTSPFGAGSEADDIAISNGNIQLASQHPSGGSVAIVRGARNDVVAYRDYNDAPSTTTTQSQPVNLPSNATEYDELQVVAQATSNRNDSTCYYRVPVERFEGRVSTAWVRIQRVWQPDYTHINNRLMDLRMRLQSGVYSLETLSNQTGGSYRPRILQVRLVSWAGVD